MASGSARGHRDGGGYPFFTEKRDFPNICTANIRTPPTLRAPPS